METSWPNLLKNFAVCKGYISPPPVKYETRGWQINIFIKLLNFPNFF